MKATTRILAALWALVLAGLWLPQISLAGYCPDSGSCCETDADCAGVGEECLDPFGVCETTGDLCDDHFDCGGRCAVRHWVLCASNEDCNPLACSEPPRIVCTVDEDCENPAATCEPNPCVAEENCVQEPAATGKCMSDDSPCASDSDCPPGDYCVRPGNCTVSGGTCNAGYPSGRCSLGGFGGQPCRADADCAYCSGDPDPAVWCDDDSDCSEETCVTYPICLMPNLLEGKCDGIAPACQDDGDCDGGTCLVSGSCTAGECSESGLPCTTAPDCGFECSLSGDPCTVDMDCGTWCDGNHAITGCTTDMDCGLLCHESGLDCTTNMDCRTECFVDGTATGDPCPSVDYCIAQGFCDPGEETCACKLYKETEVCEAIDACVPQDTCDPAEDCVINMGCITGGAAEQVCDNKRWIHCSADDGCDGCSLTAESCATDADCQDQCSRNAETACTTAEDCGKVCDQNIEVPCNVDEQCPGIGPCVEQTCLDNDCEGTCEPALLCNEVATGRCHTRVCTQDSHCADLGATPGDWTCTGDPECCTGTCGAPAARPDPQCGEGNGDCESCYAPRCLDEDGDGYGYPGGNGECLNGPAEDCDDDNDAVNPGTTEGPFGDDSCSDGLDNDCVGGADTDDPKCADPGACAASASASSSGAVSGTGTDSSVWYLLALAGVLLVGGRANRVYGHRKQ